MRLFMMSVVVPVYNGGPQLARCLRALQASSFQEFELLVVDDCSTDDTPQVIRSCAARHIRTPFRMGPAGARNVGAEHARGQILLFVDADVQVAPGALALIAEDFTRDPELAAMFGSYDQQPSAPGFFSQYKNLFHHYVHQSSSQDAVTFWAGCGAMRRDVFEEFGGFHAHRYPRPAIEDVELGFRLRRAGRRILLDKRLQVKHLKRWTLVSMIRSDIRDRAVPWSKLILEAGQMPRDLNLTYSARVSVGGTMLLVALLLMLLLAHAAGSSALAAASGAVSVALLLVALNYRIYEFFCKQRGLAFAIGAVLTHWLYYFYSGLTWAACFMSHHARAAFYPPPLIDAATRQLQGDGDPKRSAAVASSARVD